MVLRKRRFGRLIPNRLKWSSRSGSLLGLLHRRERDSRIFTNAEIIFDDFGSKDTLLLNNRGQTFVSLSGFLEILSKTELSSDKIDDFQEEIFGRVLPLTQKSPKKYSSPGLSKKRDGRLPALGVFTSSHKEFRYEDKRSYKQRCISRSCRTE